MCLSTVQMKSENFSGVGYKFAKLYGDRVYLQTGYFPFGKWVKAREVEINSDQWEDNTFTKKKRYTTGFHIFLSKQKALDQLKKWEEYILVEVSFKGAHTVGTQFGGTVVVANQMRINRVLGTVVDGKLKRTKQPKGALLSSK